MYRIELTDVKFVANKRQQSNKRQTRLPEHKQAKFFFYFQLKLADEITRAVVVVALYKKKVKGKRKGKKRRVEKCGYCGKCTEKSDLNLVPAAKATTQTTTNE